MSICQYSNLDLSNLSNRDDEFPESDRTVNQDGTFTLKMNTGQWIHDYILSFGTEIEVLEPAHVRGEMIERIAKIARKYL